MKIESGFYKDVNALRLLGDGVSAVILPEYGGKIASIRDLRSGRELLVQNPERLYSRLTPKGEYTKAECSGYDDMFPTVDPCEVNGVRYRDHGEVCRVPWKYSAAGDGMELSVSGGKLPCVLSKRIEINNGVLTVRYRLDRDAEEQASLWAGHIMLQAHPGDTVSVDFEDEIRVMFAENPPEGVACGHRSGRYTLDGKIRNFKFYFMHPHDGFTVNCFGRDGETSVRVCGDCGWLGIWVDQYGFRDYCCVGVEPATSPFDVPGADPGNGRGASEWTVEISGRIRNGEVGML